MLSDKQQYNIIRKVAYKTREFIFTNRNKLYPGSANHLGGLCDWASSALWSNLTREGLSPEVVQGGGHWFIKCGAWLVDVTASQFGQGKVCIRNYDRTIELITSNTKAMHWWHPYKVHKTIKDAGMENNIKFIEQKTGINLGV